MGFRVQIVHWEVRCETLMFIGLHYYFISNIIVVGVKVYTCHVRHIEVRRQILEVSSLLPPGAQGLNSGL